jgi:hypothetical protein
LIYCIPDTRLGRGGLVGDDRKLLDKLDAGMLQERAEAFVPFDKICLGIIARIAAYNDDSCWRRHLSYAILL